MSSWLPDVFQKCCHFLPNDNFSPVVKYAAPVAIAGVAGYILWQWKSQNTLEPLTLIEPEQEEQEKELEKFSGVLNFLPTKYELKNFDEENTLAVFINLQGPILELYETNIKIPLKELYDEPNLELTFNKMTIYNIYECCIKLLPEKLDKIFRWEYQYPIEIQLNKNSIVQETILRKSNQIDKCLGNYSYEENYDDRSIILFARSDRDKEAWTRRLRAATLKTKIPPQTDDPLLFVIAEKTFQNKPPIYEGRKIQGFWLNTLLHRIVTDHKTKSIIETSLQFQIQELLNNLTFGDRLETLIRLKVHKIDLQKFGTPKVIGVSMPCENDLGLWEEIAIKYNGLLKIIVEIKLNPKTYGKEDIKRPINQNYEDTPWIYRLSYLNYILMGGFLERTTFYLEINLDLLKGGVAINIPKQPTDTAWLGFRHGTQLVLSGSLSWGNWRLPFLYSVIDRICDQLLTSFQRNFMIPNMLQLHLAMWKQNL